MRLLRSSRSLHPPHPLPPSFSPLQALADSKCVASAHWLNDVLTEGKMFPPRSALHLPTAFQWQVPGAETYVSDPVSQAHLTGSITTVRRCGWLFNYNVLSEKRAWLAVQYKQPVTLSSLTVVELVKGCVLVMKVHGFRPAACPSHHVHVYSCCECK